MALPDKVYEELDEIIKIPTVTVTKDNVPYECKESGSSQRLRCRRYLSKDQIPFELYSFVISEGIPLTKLIEFSSGVFMNFAESSKIYS